MELFAYRVIDLGQDSPELSCTVDLHALPAELLAHIVIFCSEVPNINPDSATPELSYPAWLPITHVCHHWRMIALDHAPLWTSIPRGFSISWIKAFMERSRTMLIDLDIRIAPVGRWVGGRSLGHDYNDIILLLSNFTRIHSLHLTGRHYTIRHILDSLCSTLPIHSLSLRFEGYEGNSVLPDDLFGGKAPIRRLHLDAPHGRIVAPHWLLRGVTHFTTTELITPSGLVDVLHQMPALTYFEFRPRHLRWSTSDVDELCASPIQTPQLMTLVVHANTLRGFLLLTRLLSFQAGAKRRLEMGVPGASDWSVHRDRNHRDWDYSPLVLETANGFQLIHFSGEKKKGWFRMWTGSAVTTWEDAEFCLYAEWGGDLPRDLRRSVSAVHLIDYCDVLLAYVARVLRLVIDSPSHGLWDSYWWDLLEKLPGIEELELYPASVDALGYAWKVNKPAPAVLPELQRVRIVAPGLDQSLAQYAIIGGIPPRRIVQLPKSTEGDIASFPKAVSAEEELENVSSGFLRSLQGLGKKHRFRNIYY